MADVLLISKPQFDLPKLLSLSNELLGYSPARAADVAGLKGEPHLLACLAAFRDKEIGSTVKVCRDIYDLLSFGFIIAAYDDEMLQILEILAGIKFALAKTRIRGVTAIIAVDTFNRWKQAVLRGCRVDQPESLRVCFDKVYLQFQTIGLADAFGKLTKKPMQGGTFYLEDQR